MATSNKGQLLYARLLIIELRQYRKCGGVVKKGVQTIGFPQLRLGGRYSLPPESW